MAATKSRDIHAQLGARVEALRHRIAHASIAEIAGELESLRRLAALHRIGPALAVIAALDSALARGERGPLVQGWFAILRDAVSSEQVDERASSIFAAACSVRLVA